MIDGSASGLWHILASHTAERPRKGRFHPKIGVAGHGGAWYVGYR